ncbi:uncharacterized protein LOC131060857 [Cryptomeria japonica]|uniref:uncharacterized protein LOC131060857 n=1 Tax=Cryptomeria japonica TaxID=3369 RepID=UPI0027DA85BB|nr:uncharacterized protein LOC131060857 [Cryptomeria japonica]
MRITSWNVRGLSAPDKRCLVKRTLAKLEADIVILQETKLNDEKALEFMKYCSSWNGYFQTARGSAGGLGIMWNPSNVSVAPIISNEFWMACSISGIGTNLCFPLFNIYGLTKTMDKFRVWQEVTNQVAQLELDKVIIVGDFNALLDIDEKEGGLRKSTKGMDDFRDFVSNCKLVDIIPKNGKFTWTNRRLNFSKFSE